jgi:hypothetical protein
MLQIPFAIALTNCFRFSGGEDHPKKDGSRHGNLFAVARAVIHVDDQTGDISLLDVDDKVWQRSPVPPTLAVANQAPQSVSTSGQPAMPPASSVLPTAEAQSHINWCIANRTSDIGETNCPGEYLSTEPGCILGGGRACLLAKAVAAANRVSETLALDGYGADCDCAVLHLDSAARFVYKRSVPTVRLHAP